MADECSYENLYDVWINKIVARFKKGHWDGEKGLAEHFKHHVDELDKEWKGEITKDFLVSLQSLIDISLKLNGIDITKKDQVERLYYHWLKDPSKAEPPPVESLLTRKVVVHTEFVSRDCYGGS